MSRDNDLPSTRTVAAAPFPTATPYGCTAVRRCTQVGLLSNFTAAALSRGADEPRQPAMQIFHLVMIKSSHYDDEGYAIQWWRSGMPSNTLPGHPGADDRIVLEAYPALVARRWIGRRGYKSDTRSKQTRDQRLARERLVAALESGEALEHFGVTVSLPRLAGAELIADPTGDSLDALLCALQAAWAWGRRAEGFGIPGDADPVEGWIVDPGLTLDDETGAQRTRTSRSRE
jgi:hypothetical protein